MSSILTSSTSPGYLNWERPVPKMRHDDPDRTATPSPADARLQREAEQLRNNLGRRKQQARARELAAAAPDEEMERS